MPEWLMEILVNFWAVLGEMAPYLLFGFLVAGVLSVLISPELVERHLGGRGLWPVIKASAFGVPLPLCSCGVIPVAASIRKHGASKAATTAFLISTPQTGADSILATLSLLGPIFAICRPIAALVSGIVGGVIVSATANEPSDRAGANEKCHDACCSSSARPGKIYRILSHGFIMLPRDIGRTLLIGLAAAALISAIVPKGYFSTVVPPGVLQILVLMLVGIPVYICATASIPIAAGLILAGVSPGAAFALLVTGPATNAATVAMVWKVMGKGTCLIYLATMTITAFLGGLLLDQIVGAQDVQVGMHHGWIPTWIKTVSAIVLLGVLAAGVICGPGSEGRKDVSRGNETLELTIRGMTCRHCAESVKQALLRCPDVETAEIDLSTGRAVISGSRLDAELLCKAVEEVGYAAEAWPGKPLPDVERV